MRVTVITAAIDGTMGALAFDSESTDDIRTAYEPKGVKLRHDVAVGSSGTVLIKRWFRTLAAKADEMPAPDSDDFALWLETQWDAWHEWLKDRGHGKRFDGAERLYSADVVVVTPRKIYSLESNGAVCECALPYHSAGSGGEVAMGALCAVRSWDQGKGDTNPAIRAMLAAIAATTHAQGCGGKVTTLEVTAE